MGCRKQWLFLFDCRDISHIQDVIILDILILFCRIITEISDVLLQYMVTCELFNIGELSVVLVVLEAMKCFRTYNQTLPTHIK